MIPSIPSQLSDGAIPTSAFKAFLTSTLADWDKTLDFGGDAQAHCQEPFVDTGFNFGFGVDLFVHSLYRTCGVPFPDELQFLK